MKTLQFSKYSLSAKVWMDEEKKNVILLFSGSMDTISVNEFKDKLEGFLSNENMDYFVDLSLVKYISSTGLGILSMFLKNKRERVIIIPSKNVKEALSMMDIYALFQESNEIRDMEQLGIPEEVMKDFIDTKTHAEKIQIEYYKRWVKILRDLLPADQVIKEVHNIGKFLPSINADTITFPSEEKYAALVYKFFETHSILDEEAREFVAKELVTNSVIHGYKGSATGTIQVYINKGEDKIKIEFRDWGKGFGNSSTKGTGNGLTMIKKIFDEVNITISPPPPKGVIAAGKGTTIILWKKNP